MSINKSFVLIITIALAICGHLSYAQEMKFESNADRNERFIAPTLDYFSAKYDLTIGFQQFGRELKKEDPFRVFAKKGNTFYKLDCSYVSAPPHSPFKFVIKKKKRCSKEEGEMFKDSLIAHHIFTLEPQTKRPKCVYYDSTTKKMETFSGEYADAVGFTILDKKKYRVNFYNSIPYYVSLCPNEWLNNIQALIDLFEKHW